MAFFLLAAENKCEFWISLLWICAELYICEEHIKYEETFQQLAVFWDFFFFDDLGLENF